MIHWFENRMFEYECLRPSEHAVLRDMNLRYRFSCMFMFSREKIANIIIFHIY